MFKIGDFSKICQVSAKTLRHWDEVDLLKPAHIDKFTSYRYYDIAQLEQVNRIIAYKGLGLSLTQIKELLDEHLSAEEIRGMLRLKQAELKQELEERERMLRLVETRLNLIESEGKLPEHNAIIKSVPAQTMLVTRDRVSDFRELVDFIFETNTIHAEYGGTTHSPLTAIFHDDDFESTDLDVSLGFVVDQDSDTEIALNNGRKMAVQRLPKVEMMAVSVHKGAWTTLPEGYGMLGRWINANGYAINGVGREIFHHIGEPDNPQLTVTELQFPVVKAE